MIYLILKISYNHGMNIALFSDCYTPTKNGVVTVIIQLRKMLEQLGHHERINCSICTIRFRNRSDDGFPSYVKNH